MKIVILDTAIPINTRNQKFLESFGHFFPDAEISVISWQREPNTIVPEPYYILYSKPSKYGSQWKKLYNLLGYSRFVSGCLRKINPDVILASHWDTLVLIPKDVFRRSFIIYDNLDVPTGMLPVRKIQRFLEMRKVKHADVIVHASRFFKALYPSKYRQVVIENKTTFQFSTRTKSLHQPLVLSYIGLVRYKEIFFNLIDAVRTMKDDVILRVCGAGQDLDEVSKYAASVSATNVEFTGRYTFDEIPSLYEKCDLVWAAYPNKDYNVKYAISNKFHESIVNGVPGIYSDETLLGDFVDKERIGYIVDPYSIEGIRQLIKQIVADPAGIEQRVNNLAVMSSKETSWEEDMKELYNIIIEGKSKNYGGEY